MAMPGSLNRWQWAVGAGAGAGQAGNASRHLNPELMTRPSPPKDKTMKLRKNSGCRALASLLLALCGSATPLPSLAAGPLEGTRVIYAETAGGQRQTIGRVSFTPVGDGSSRYRLTIDHQPFQDYFLSMREFKCLNGGGEIACHVPYPHPHPKVVSAADLAWLEHELLFFFKLPGEFGARLRNGLYFELRADGDRLVGTLQAIDLDLIAAAPADAGLPPYAAALREQIPGNGRFLTRIIIE